MLKNHTTKFHLACFIITLPFYAHAQEQSTSSEQQPDLMWHFTLTRTTPEVTQEWLQLIADYGTAASNLFDNEMHKEIQDLFAQLQTLTHEKSFTLSLACNSQDTDISSLEPKNIQLYTGQILADILKNKSADDGIHGELGVYFDIDLLEPKPTDKIEWKLEIYLHDTYSPEAFNETKNNLAALTDELNTASFTPDNQNYGSLLHGVAASAQQKHAYSCNATLTLKS
jgi:hypothetical protein